MRVRFAGPRQFRLATVQNIMTRARIIDALMDTGEYPNRKEAARAIDTVSGILRAWLIAWTQDCPKDLEAHIELPGALSLYLGWNRYPHGARDYFRLSCRLTKHARLAYRRANIAALIEAGIPPVDRSNDPRRNRSKARQTASTETLTDCQPDTEKTTNTGV